ncbi:MAG: glycosyltransferase family 9 protein [Planctomycetales bacterium]|nr:glycosyltransferase family 9 protein [Planctomycetales bacterium]
MNTPSPLADVREDRSSPTTPPLTLAVFLPTWVGDACMATATLRTLRGSFPHARIVGIGRPLIHELLAGSWAESTPWLDEAILLRKGKQGAGFSKLGLLGPLRRLRPDVALLLTNAWWSAAVARLAGAQRTVGYDRDARGWLLTDRLPVPRDGRDYRPLSAVDYYLGIAHWLGCDTSDRRMQLRSNSSERQRAKELWRQVGFSNTIPTVAINSGSATDPSRVWPREHIRELAVRLAGELSCQVLLHCGPGERDACNRTAAEARHPRVASMGQLDDLPIGLSKAVLERAQVVVSTDSGPRHIAVALDRPVIALHGPTHPAWTRTYNLPETVIAENSMQDITVERVLAAVRMALARPHVAQPHRARPVAA